MSPPLAFIGVAFIFFNDLLVDKVLETVPMKSYVDEMFLIVKKLVLVLMHVFRSPCSHSKNVAMLNGYLA